MPEAGSASIPGFIDLQVNGTHGIDFSAAGLTHSDCLRAFDRIRRSGSAAFLPTVITSPLDLLLANLETVSTAASAFDHPGAVAGIHLEGPFLDARPGAIGAHNPHWVVPPDPAVFDRLQQAADGAIRILTLSAGLDGSEALIEHASGRGVVVSLGHHLAGYEAIRRAADAGAVLLTHLGNGLPAEVNRHENPLFAGLVEDRLAASFIADGRHLPFELVRMILRMKGCDRSIVVSDSSPVAGLGPGRYEALGTTVEVAADGSVVMPGTPYLAGSGRTLLECMNWLAGCGVLSYEELLAVGMSNPARLLEMNPDALDGPGVVFDRGLKRFGIRG